jgi:hypothetical protein
MPTHAEASNANRVASGLAAADPTIAALAGALLMLLLSIAGLIHIRRTSEDATI